MEDKNRKFFKSLLGMEISDMTFKHHMEHQNNLNIAIISFQLLLCISSLILSALTNINFSKYSACINVTLLLVVMVNNAISRRAWDKARNKQDKIIALLDILDDTDISFEDLHLHFSHIRGYNVPHTDKRFENLMQDWYSPLNKKKREKLEYKDADGKNYHIGDIVFNPCFEDMWWVKKLSEEDMKKFGFTIPYVLVLYGNEDEYIMEIDEPVGFKIECTPNDIYSYIKCVVLFGKAYQVHREELDVMNNKKEVKDNGEQQVETEGNDK